jgi:hypothetical protein
MKVLGELVRIGYVKTMENGVSNEAKIRSSEPTPITTQSILIFLVGIRIWSRVDFLSVA